MVSKDEESMGQLQQRIFNQLDHFKEVNLFHISRHNDQDADRLTNDIITLEQSCFLLKMGAIIVRVSYHLVPLSHTT